MAFPSTSVLDNFNRANGALGGDWGGNLFSGDNDLVVDSNQAKGSNHLANNGWATQFGPDCEAWTEIVTYTDHINVVCRWSVLDGSPSGYMVAAQADVGQIKIYRFDSGSLTQLDSIPQTVVSGDWLGMRVVGDTISAYYRDISVSSEWVLVGEVTDSTHSAAGFIGLYHKNSTTFSDNFGGGDFVADAAGASIFRGRSFPFFDDEQVNRFEFWPAVDGGADVNVGLTGISSVSAIGTLGLSRAHAAQGQSGTSTAGILSSAASIQTAGVGTTASTELLIVQRTKGIIGFESAVSLGILTPGISITVSGLQSALSVGLAVGGQPLTGIEATTNVGSVGSAATYSLTGVGLSGFTGATPSASTIPVSGVTCSVSVGSVVASFSMGLLDQTVTGSVGSNTPSTTIGLSGQQTTGAAGLATPVVPGGAALTGVQSIGQIGNLGFTKSGTAGINSVVVTGAAGTLVPTFATVVVGGGLTATVGTLVQNHAIGLTSAQSPTALGSFEKSFTSTIGGVSNSGQAGTVSAGIGSAGVVIKGPLSISLNNSGKYSMNISLGSTSLVLSSDGSTSIEDI